MSSFTKIQTYNGEHATSFPSPSWRKKLRKPVKKQSREGRLEWMKEIVLF